MDYAIPFVRFHVALLGVARDSQSIVYVVSCPPVWLGDYRFTNPPPSVGSNLNPLPFSSFLSLHFLKALTISSER